MDANKPAVAEYSNMLLVNFLMVVKGHKILDVRKDLQDPRKSLAVFENTAALIKDVEDYHNDVPCLFKPRSYEKHFKDIKFVLNNPSLFNRK